MVNTHLDQHHFHERRVSNDNDVKEAAGPDDMPVEEQSVLTRLSDICDAPTKALIRMGKGKLPEKLKTDDRIYGIINWLAVACILMGGSAFIFALYSNYVKISTTTFISAVKETSPLCQEVPRNLSGAFKVDSSGHWEYTEG